MRFDILAVLRLGDTVLTGQSVEHDPDHVLAGIMLAHRAADALHHPFTGRLLGRGFWSHLRSFVTTMGPKIVRLR